MKEQLIEFSRAKGFLSKDKLISVSDDYYYLWMCELQKWLRDEHNIRTFVEENAFETYEQGFEHSLMDGLRLVPMPTQRIILTNEQIQMIDNYADVIFGSDDDRYYHIPFWFKPIKGKRSDMYDVIFFKNLPKYLQDRYLETKNKTKCISI